MGGELQEQKELTEESAVTPQQSGMSFAAARRAVPDGTSGIRAFLAHPAGTWGDVLGLMLRPAPVPYLVCTLHLPLVSTSWPCCALLSICLLSNDTAVTLTLPCAIPADV